MSYSASVIEAETQSEAVDVRNRTSRRWLC